MKKTAPVFATPAEVAFLALLLEELRPRVVVEIGTWLGGTAQVLMEYAERLYCVDHWRGDGSIRAEFPGASLTPWERFREFVEVADERFLRTVIPCVGDSQLWCTIWNQPIDLLYIDGDHSYEGVKADILGWSPHVRPGGFILGHDYETHPGCMFPGVARAVDEIYPDRLLRSGTRFWSVPQ